MYTKLVSYLLTSFNLVLIPSRNYINIQTYYYNNYQKVVIIKFLATIKGFFGFQTQTNGQRRSQHSHNSEYMLSRSQSTFPRTNTHQEPSQSKSTKQVRNAHSNQKSQRPKPQSQSKPTSKKIYIMVKTIKGVQSIHTVSSQMIGFELKQYIYRYCCKSLEPKLMDISCGGTLIGNLTKLNTIAPTSGNYLRIQQTKRSVAQISNLSADVHGIDPISLEQGTVKMPCGHHIGRDTMTAMVRSLINTKSYQIRCPFPNRDQVTCNAVWQFSLCKKVGVFTAEEVREFQKGLTINWAKEFCKKCPKCKTIVYKGDLKTNRVVCPWCKYGDFCFTCLKPWKQNSSNSCTSEECRFLNDSLKNCPWDKKFQLRDLKDKKTVKTYRTPRYRACPHCNLIIQHSKGCKHIACKGCGKSFCWVCLAVPSQDWPCGKFKDYCGKIAQIQAI